MAQTAGVPKPPSSERDADAIFRVCTFPRPDLQYGLGYSRPDDMEAVRASMQESFAVASGRLLPPPPPAAPLEQLPPEVFFLCMAHLDVLSSVRLRQASRRLRMLVTAYRPYHILATRGGLPAIRALIRGHVAHQCRLDDLCAALTSRLCAVCHAAYGGFLFLFDAQRCCLRCLAQSPRLHVVEPGDLARQCRLDRRALQALLGVHTSHGTLSSKERAAQTRHARHAQPWPAGSPPATALRVHRDARGVYELFYTPHRVRHVLRMADCVRLLQGAVTVDADADTDTDTGDRTPWQPYGAPDGQHACNAAIRFPSYCPATDTVEHGASCHGCQEQRGRVSSSFWHAGTWHSWDDLYTADDYLAHFRRCPAARAIWDASEGGTNMEAVRAKTPGFAEQGGYCAVDAAGQPVQGHRKPQRKHEPRPGWRRAPSCQRGGSWWLD